MRKFRTFFLWLCSLLCAESVCAQHAVWGVVKDLNGNPVAGAAVTVRLQADSTYCKGSATDGNGKFAIEGLIAGEYRIEVSFLGYTDFCQTLILDKNCDIGVVYLQEKALALEEVSVTASMVKRFADKKEYRLADKEKEQYSSVLSALEILPKIQVLDQTVTAVDGKAVKVLINGIPATPADLSVMPSESISKIDYYTQPPVQYSNMGLGAVINIVTKEKQRGGVVGISTQNAITTGFGNNVVNLKYNWGNSQIGITYNVNYRSYDKRVLDEKMKYIVGGVDYEKSKWGKHSPYAYEQQMAEVSFNNSKVENYVFSVKLAFRSLNRRRSSVQDILSRVDKVEIKKTGESMDKDKYISPVMDMYFSKNFGVRHGFTMNIVGTYYNSDYDYKYEELTDGKTDFRTATVINTNKYSFIGEVLYRYKMRAANLYAGSRYMYNNNVQNQHVANNRIVTNEIYSYLGITGMLAGKFNYSISAGMCNHIFTTIRNKKFKFLYFRPQVKLGYFINQDSELMFNYEVNTENPSVSSLTYNPYFKDSNYVFVGNPDLKSENHHDFMFSYFKGFKKFVMNAELKYSFIKEAIAPVFQSDNANVIETFGNLDKSQNMKADLFLQYYPLSNNMLRMRLYAEIFHQRNKWGNSGWSHTGYSIIPSLFFVYKKWGLQLLYQTGKKVLDGQIVRSIPSMASVELSYKPIKNLSITGGIRYPFYDAWKQVSSVAGTSLLHRIEAERIMNNANMVYINLAYNISFGRNRQMEKLKIENADKDTGILNRY